MKNILIRAMIAIFALAAVACDKDEKSVDTVVIDFEGEEYTSLVAKSSYSADVMTQSYFWQDKKTTLCSRPLFNNAYGYTSYGGGCTLSSYNSNDLSKVGSYEYDLYIYNKKGGNEVKGGGNRGSDNFLVTYGNYEPEIDPNNDMRPAIYFADGKARIIRGCYINSTTYFLNIAQNGNAFSEALSEGDEVIISATGYDHLGREGKTLSRTFARKGEYITEWTRWDLSALGEVVKIKFNITGGPTTEWGMTSPRYIGIDDIEVELTN